MECIRVLLVDDEEEFRTTLATRLKMRDMEVAEAASGEEALVLLREEVFDVVVLDIRMPGMDGIETLRSIKRMQPTTEVIMLTGHASVDSGIHGMRLGAFDYLMKPCDLGELTGKIQAASPYKGHRGA